MAQWYKIPLTFRVTDREYEANITGINIVFGAVLGFVLAGTEGLPARDFMMLLFVSASVVVSILYMGSSQYTLFYTIAAAVLIAALPYILKNGLEIEPVPALQPTLAVWAIMIVIVELLPRQKLGPQAEKDSNK